MTNRNPLAQAVLSAILALSLAACAGGASAEPPPVPADALGWVQIDDPLAALKGLDAFWTAAGIEDATGKTLAESFLDEIGQQGADPVAAFREVDASRPVVLALLPAVDGGEPRIEAYLPLRNGERSKAAFVEAFASEDPALYALVGSWLVVAEEGPAPAAAPTARLALSKADPKRPGAIRAFGLVGPLLDAFASEVSGALAEVAEAADVLEATDSFPYDLESLSALSLELLDQVERVEFAVVFDDAGVDLDFGVVPEEGSSANAFGRRIADGAGPLRHLERIPADALFAGAWSANPGVLAELAKGYLAALDMGDAFGPGYEAYLDACAAAAGPSGASSFDLTLAPDLVARLSATQDPQAMVSLLDKGISVDLRAIYAVPEPEAWYGAMAAIADDGIYGADFQDLMEEAGLAFDIRHSSEGEGAARYDTISYVFKLGPSLAAGLDQPTFRMIQGLTDKLMAKFELGVAVRDGLGLMSTGGPATLEALALGKLAAPATADPGWKRFLERSPEGQRFAGKLSTRSLARMLAAFKDVTGLALDPADLDGWFFGLSADESRFGFSASLPSSDFRAFVDLYLTSGGKPLGI